MPQAARLFLQADTLLYNAAHADTIFHFFNERHILGSHVVVGVAPPAAPGAGVWATDAFARGGAARVQLAAPVHLLLLNATGARVWEGRAAADVLTEVPAAALPPGVYLLRVLPATGPPRTVRLMRQ